MNILGKVSIIVPVYNSEKTLGRCVESLILQTYKNVEIILVNDGSKDNSQALMVKLYEENKEIVKVISQKNAGVAAARNSGLKAVTGDYVMFVDSDDYLDNSCIEKVMKKSAEKDVDIVRFKLTYKYMDGSEIIEGDDFKGEAFIEKKDFKSAIYDKMLSGIKMNSICRTIYKKRVIDNILFREDMITAEDLIFNIEAFTNASNFLYLPYPFYYYYQSNRGLTGNGISVLTKYKCNFIVSKIILAHLEKWEMRNFKNVLKTVFRLYFITLSKIKRSILKNV